MKNLIIIIVLSLSAITANAKGGHTSHSSSHHSSHASHVSSHVSVHSSSRSSKGVSNSSYNPRDYISTKTTKIHITKLTFKLAKTPKPIVSHFKATKTSSSLAKVDKLTHITMPKMKATKTISVHGKTISLPDYTISSSVKHTIHGNGDTGKTTAHKIRTIHTHLTKHKIK